MTDNKALEKLYDIIDMESDGFQSGKLIRRKELTKWIESWTEIIKSEQSIVNNKYLHGDYEENLKELLAYRMIDDATEKAVIYRVTDKKIESKMLVIRRNGKN